MIIDDKANELAAQYESVKPFLRAIPAHYDREYGLIPKDPEMFSYFADGERGDSECPVGPFRSAAGSSVWDPEGAAYLVWMPDCKRFNPPTFRQFLAAYHSAPRGG